MESSLLVSQASSSDQQRFQIQSRQLLFDFENEYVQFMNRDWSVQEPNVQQRPRLGTTSAASAGRVTSDFHPDGSIEASALSYDALCQISGRSSLSQVTSLSLMVVFRYFTDSLAILSRCLRCLHTLKLDHSNVATLRVLGDELPTLKTLSVCSCGLQDLDGLSYAPNLVTLIAADNHINDALPITELRRIHTLDLENNDFEDYNSLSFLFICSKLENLVLKGNPISMEDNYRFTIFRILPMLKNLDVILFERPARSLCRAKSKDDGRDHDGDQDHDHKPAFSLTHSSPTELETVLDKEIMGTEEEAVTDTFSLQAELIQSLIRSSPEDNQAETEQNDLAERSESGPCEEAQEIERIDGDKEDSPPCPDETLSGEQTLSPSFRRRSSGNLKLLNRRQSVDPVKLRDFCDQTTSLEEPGRLVGCQDLNSRPESSMSICSTNTSCSISMSTHESDSGVDVCNLKGPIRPRLAERRGSGLPVKEAIAISTKKTDAAKLLRTSSRLSGLKTTQGDIEIEDFDQD